MILTDSLKEEWSIRPTIKELLDTGIEVGIEVGAIVKRGFLFLKNGNRVNIKGGVFVERGERVYLLWKGYSFGEGTRTARIAV